MNTDPIVEDFETRLRIVQSDYGRDFGWYVERDGQRLGVLSEPTFADMFWVRYRILPVRDDPEVEKLLFEEDYWVSPKYRFINREFSKYNVEAFGPVESDRRHVTMRGLYLNVSFTIAERIFRCFCLWRAHRKLKRDSHNREPAEAPE